LTANYASNFGADPPPGELTDSELDAMLAAADSELLGYVTASAHPEAGLLAIMAANSANSPSEDAAGTSQPALAVGDSARAAVSEMLSAARTFRDAHARVAALAAHCQAASAVSRASENAEVMMLQRTAARHSSRVAAARQSLAARHSELAKLAAALEESLDEIRPPHQRYRIGRRLEMTILLIITAAEAVVAATVVQTLGLSAVFTALAAVVVGGAATGLAWLAGHEWAVAHDPQAAANGRRGWLAAARVTVGAFLAANLAARVYHGLVTGQAAHLGSSIAASLLAGLLLTAVTAALMVVAAFVTAHAETGKEAELRARLRQVHNELRHIKTVLNQGENGLARQKAAYQLPL
jgi:hypothetical protein